MIAAEKRHEDDLYAALWKQDEQVKAAREVAETAEQLKRNQGRKSNPFLQNFCTILWFRIRSGISSAGTVPFTHFKIRWTFCASKLLQRKHSVKQPNELLSKRLNL